MKNLLFRFKGVAFLSVVYIFLTGCQGMQHGELAHGPKLKPVCECSCVVTVESPSGSTSVSTPAEFDCTAGHDCTSNHGDACVVSKNRGVLANCKKVFK